jgi:replicative DNA helicase
MNPGTGIESAPLHSLEAERAVLGAILINQSAHERTAIWLRRGRVFFRQAHRLVYGAVLHVWKCSASVGRSTTWAARRTSVA